MSVLGGVSGLPLARARTPDEEERLRQLLATLEAEELRKRSATNLGVPSPFGGAPSQSSQMQQFNPSMLAQSQSPESQRQGDIIASTGKIAQGLFFPEPPQPISLAPRPIQASPISPQIQRGAQDFARGIEQASLSSDPLGRGVLAGKETLAPALLPSPGPAIDPAQLSKRDLSVDTAYPWGQGPQQNDWFEKLMAILTVLIGGGGDGD